MMKILQINKLYFPWIGGVEKIVQDIAEGLKDRVDMKVLVCRDRGKKEIDRVNNIEVTRASSFGIFYSMPISFDFPILLNRLSRDRDILHFHMPFPLADLSYYFNLRKKKKVIIWWHSDIVKQKKALLIYKPFLLSFLKKAEKIMVATPRHVESSIFLKNLEYKCEVIPFGINQDKFLMTSVIHNKVVKIHNIYGKNIVLFIGRLIYYKGVEYLIEAMKNVDANLIIIGDGPLKDNLSLQTKRIGVDKKIFFLGGLDDSDVVAYYHACKVFVLPSVENTEAFGIVQMEAMACGKPVINTDLPTGVPYVSLNGKTGVTVPVKNADALSKAIRNIIFNDDLREKFGANALQRIEKEFTMDRMMNRIYKVYENVYNQTTKHEI